MSDGAIASEQRDRLYRTVADVLGMPPSAVADDSSPETVGAWDSLNHLKLVMALEAEFGVSFTPEDVMDMRNVALIQTILHDHGVEC